MAEILVADNDENYLKRLVEKVLPQLGHEAVGAGSVEEALSMVKEGKFDLVLTDLRLTDDFDEKDTSGLRVAKWAHERGIRYIVLTSFLPGSPPPRVRDLHASGWIIVPKNLLVVEAEVARALESK